MIFGAGLWLVWQCILDCFNDEKLIVSHLESVCEASQFLEKKEDWLFVNWIRSGIRHISQLLQTKNEEQNPLTNIEDENGKEMEERKANRTSGQSDPEDPSSVRKSEHDKQTKEYCKARCIIRSVQILALVIVVITACRQESIFGQGQVLTRSSL